MEKLLQLLNQYEKEKNNRDEDYNDRELEGWRIVNRSYDPDVHKFLERYIVSPEFEFISRLYSKEKIDIEKYSKLEYKPYFYNKITWNFCGFWLVNWIIQYLSIQNEPIYALILILK